MDFSNNSLMHKLIFYVIAGVMLLGLWGVSARATSEIVLHAIRFGVRPDGLRMVLDSSDALEVIPIRDESLLIVPLPPIAWDGKPPQPPKNSCILSCDLSPEAGGQMRLACEMTETAELKTFFKIPPDDAHTYHRLAVDMRAEGRKPKAEITEPAPMPEMPAAAPETSTPEAPSFEAQIQAALAETPQAEPKVATLKETPPAETEETPNAPPPLLPPKKPLGNFEVTVIEGLGDKRLVVIDPGHGGADPGTTGVSGTHEKHITLAAAKTLKRVLEATGRYTVVLTREEDVFMKLRERIDRAKAHKGHLFLSIHADAHKNPETRGMSFYTLSKVASDEEAEKLAQKENKADLILGLDLSSEPEDVANILIDLVQREHMNLSTQLAQNLRQAMGKHIKLLRNSHRFADFGVLKAPDMPAVLIELGYLSNHEDEQLLQNPAHLERIAAALLEGIDSYLGAEK